MAYKKMLKSPIRFRFTEKKKKIVTQSFTLTAILEKC